MTICEIVAQAKEGDRFVACGVNDGSYYYKQDNLILFMDSRGIGQVANFHRITELTALYTFLPPEPKFKVGDEVAHIGNKQKIGVIDMVEHSRGDTSWGYRVPSWGWFHETSLTLYTGPDTCDKCGQEVGDKVEVTEKEPNPRFSPKDMVVIIGNHNRHEFNIGDIVTIEGEGSKGNSGYLYYASKKGKTWYPIFQERDLAPHTEPPIEWDGGDLPKWKAYLLDWKKWDWVTNSGKKKRDWPWWKKNGGTVANAQEDCFACEYREQDNSASCNDCLMWGLWGGNCCSPKSPYKMWELTRATHHAQTIADFAKKKYYEEIGRKP